jgi:hypothetical protein
MRVHTYLQSVPRYRRHPSYSDQQGRRLRTSLHPPSMHHNEVTDWQKFIEVIHVKI